MSRLLSSRLNVGVNSTGVPSLSIDRAGGNVAVSGAASDVGGGSAGDRTDAAASGALPRNAHGHRLGLASTVAEWKEWIEAHWRSLGLGDDPEAPDERVYEDKDFYGLG